MTDAPDGHSWRALGRPAPERLPETRLALHWAAQIVGDAGRTINPPHDDDSHTNLGWDAARGSLERALDGGGVRARIGLRLADATLWWRAPDGSASEIPLVGRTLDEGYAWLEEHLTSAGWSAGTLQRTPNEPPSAPVGSGAPLRIDPPAAEELSRWYENAAGALGRVVGTTPDASPVRCWPHHFDIATLISVGAGRTVGVGMTPGDDSYVEPYWYVTPYPHPESREPGPLEGGGQWHGEDWFGAVLRGSRLVEGAGTLDQQERTERFLASAIVACRALLAD